MKAKKKCVIIIAIILLALSAIALIIYFFTHKGKDNDELANLGPRVTETATVTPIPTEETPEATVTPEPTPVYVSPVNFDELQAINPDIYAWIDIPGTEISYPVLQSPDDDTLYLNHDYNKNSNGAGSLMTEHAYNGTDFSDPVTMIYGHNMLNGDMFGSLQKTFSNADFFNSQGEIIVYLPDKELHYETFAALPHDGWHILYNVDFSNPRTHASFFNGILSARELGAQIKTDTVIEPDDKVIILSTCLRGNRNRRFFVCAKLIS